MQGASSPQNTPLILSGGSAGVQTLAPGGLAFALGQGLATTTAGPLTGAPTTIFSGSQVTIRDYAGNTSVATLIYVSPTQITFQIPTSVATGPAQIQVTSPTGVQWPANAYITSPAPALFTQNGLGLPAAFTTTVSGAQGQTFLPIWSVTNGAYNAVPITISGNTYLSLYGTGFQGAPTTATVNGVNANVTYVGASGYPGVDQVNLVLPASAAGKGTVPVQLTAGGVAANTVAILVK